MGNVCGNPEEAIVPKDADFGTLPWHLRGANYCSEKEIEQRAHQWSADVMGRYDKDGNMNVDVDEAKPLYRQTFEYMAIVMPEDPRVKGRREMGVGLIEMTGFNYLTGDKDNITQD